VYCLEIRHQENLGRCTLKWNMYNNNLCILKCCTYFVYEYVCIHLRVILRKILPKSGSLLHLKLSNLNSKAFKSKYFYNTIIQYMHQISFCKASEHQLIEYNVMLIMHTRIIEKFLTFDINMYSIVLNSTKLLQWCFIVSLIVAVFNV